MIARHALADQSSLWRSVGFRERLMSLERLLDDVGPRMRTPLRPDQHLSVASACVSEGGSRRDQQGGQSSINQFVTTAVAEKVASTKTAGFFAARAGEADVEAARRILRREGGQSPEPEDRRE